MGKRRLVSAALLLAVLAGAVGCGSSSNDAASVPGMTISGPGLQTTRPPWKPEYAHLAQRMRAHKIPPPGTERFHIHALLHVYVDGLLSPISENIGIDKARRLESALHTHDATGILHMEATRPHGFTLGDFFAVWGVKLGPAQVGGLTGLGADKPHFYVNGRPLRNPAAHMLRADDSIVIGYGGADRFPHNPDTTLLRALKSGDGTALSCSALRRGRRVTSCLAPATRTKTKK